MFISDGVISLFDSASVKLSALSLDDGVPKLSLPLLDDPLDYLVPKEGLDRLRVIRPRRYLLEQKAPLTDKLLLLVPCALCYRPLLESEVFFGSQENDRELLGLRVVI